MDKRELQSRTKRFGLRVIRLANALPKSLVARTVGQQLLRCGLSVGANYRAACKSRSVAEFIARIGVVEEEADECCYWMEMLIEAGIMEKDLLAPLLQEANEITAIMAASRKSAARKTVR